MDNDETDAQGRAARWRTGSSLSDSAWPYPHHSVWGFHSSFLLCVLVQGREQQMPLQCHHQLFFTPTAVHLSCFCHGPSAYTWGSSWLKWWQSRYCGQGLQWAAGTHWGSVGRRLGEQGGSLQCLRHGYSAQLSIAMAMKCWARKLRKK